MPLSWSCGFTFAIVVGVLLEAFLARNDRVPALLALGDPRRRGRAARSAP